jgi:hypothetical protein
MSSCELSPYQFEWMFVNASIKEGNSRTDSTSALRCGNSLSACLQLNSLGISPAFTDPV